MRVASSIKIVVIQYPITYTCSAIFVVMGLETSNIQSQDDFNIFFVVKFRYLESSALIIDCMGQVMRRPHNALDRFQSPAMRIRPWNNTEFKVIIMLQILFL